MLPPPTIRDWARKLIDSEVDADPTSARTDLATLRVYEKIRRQLCAPVGVNGFQALASRALSLAKSQSPKLDAVQITASGSLRGIGEGEFHIETDAGGEVGIVLISQLLGLFLTLLGETATVRLIEGSSLSTEVKVSAKEAPAALTDKNYFGPFKDILSEADQLRNVSERLEALAEKHADVGELESVAWNIRTIANVLDVFTIIRSQVGGSDDKPIPPLKTGYLN